MTPKLLTTLPQTTRASLLADVLAGVTVALVALPLSVAIAIASGAAPGAGDARSALHLAASRGLDDVITRLAEHGASLTVRNVDGETPLSLARARSAGDGAPSSTVALLQRLGATDTAR